MWEVFYKKISTVQTQVFSTVASERYDHKTLTFI